VLEPMSRVLRTVAAEPGLIQHPGGEARAVAVIEALRQGGSFRTSTRPTLNLILLSLNLILLSLNLILLLRESILAFILKVSHAPISVECLFSKTLL